MSAIEVKGTERLELSRGDHGLATMDLLSSFATAATVVVS